jgi:hypothetical protein
MRPCARYDAPLYFGGQRQRALALSLRRKRTKAEACRVRVSPRRHRASANRSRVASVEHHVEVRNNGACQCSARSGSGRGPGSEAHVLCPQNPRRPWARRRDTSPVVHGAHVDLAVAATLFSQTEASDLISRCSMSTFNSVK